MDIGPYKGQIGMPQDTLPGGMGFDLPRLEGRLINKGDVVLSPCTLAKQMVVLWLGVGGQRKQGLRM